jgi:hypothetical protein
MPLGFIAGSTLHNERFRPSNVPDRLMTDSERFMTVSELLW